MRVLDTNTLSWLMRGDEAVVGKLISLPRNTVLLPQPVVAEVAYGLARLPKSARRARLNSRFEVFLAELGRAEWNDDVSWAFGEAKTKLERAGSPLDDFDIAIAAHALARDAILVTDNLGHMSRIAGLHLENWRDRA